MNSFSLAFLGSAGLNHAIAHAFGSTGLALAQSLFAARPDDIGYGLDLLAGYLKRNWISYDKDDPAKEPLATGESIPGVISNAANKTGRPRDDFQVEEISRERYEKLKEFLG